MAYSMSDNSEDRIDIVSTEYLGDSRTSAKRKPPSLEQQDEIENELVESLKQEFNVDIRLKGLISNMKLRFTLS